MSRILVIFLIIFMFSHCKQETVLVEKLFTFEKDSNSVFEKSGNGVNGFIRIDSTKPLGFLFTYKLNEDDFHSPFQLEFSGKVRTNYLYSTGAIVYVTSNKDGTVSWDGSNMTRHVTDLNKWCVFHEKVNLRQSNNSFYFDHITIQAILGNPKAEIVDFDSLMIKITR